MIDPVTLTAQLVRCPSVTPTEGGALELLASVLGGAGFECTRVDREGVPNLFARWGPKGAKRTFGFNGHTDVVPVGDAGAWSHDPFGATIEGEWLYGRGSTDMKSGVASFVAAAIERVAENPDGAIIIAITGDEEGDAHHGTRAILDWMGENGEQMSVCLVGEPTCPDHMGEAIKIGRRGSMSAIINVIGKQGHVAYPTRAINPVNAMARLAARLCEHELDQGSDHFEPTRLQMVTIDTDNPAGNVIPAKCTARLNIRFNDLHTSKSLSEWITKEADQIAQDTGARVDIDFMISGECFFTPPGVLSDMVASAVAAETGRTPELSTSGGTSDARFVKDHCPVIECGLVGHRMHAVDERVNIGHVHQLKAIYARIMEKYFE